MKIKVKQGVPLTMDAHDWPTFDEWLERVDAVLVRCRGVSVYDLPDAPYRDWYLERLRPIRAANRALDLCQRGEYEDELA
jgi:hypothetical protein